MLTAFVGNPGSGKTYGAVYYLWESIYRKSDLGLYYLPDGVAVFSNIRNLRLPHRDFDRLYEKHGKAVFTVAFWEKVLEKYSWSRIVLVVDEAQRYLYKEKDKDVLYFFQYHRHLGMEILLITQTLKNLPLEIRHLMEFYYFAVPRSRNLGNWFVYHIKDPTTDEKLGVKRLPKKREVFELYTSQEFGELEKGVNFTWKYIAVAVGAIALSITGLFFTIHTFFSPKKTKRLNPSPSQHLSSSSLSVQNSYLQGSINLSGWEVSR